MEKDILNTIICDLDTESLFRFTKISRYFHTLSVKKCEDSVNAVKIIEKYHQKYFKNYLRNKGFYIYIFALGAENYIPSGTINFNRLSNFTIEMKN